MVNCLCIFQDKVLAYIIKNYISKTPFLSYIEWQLFVQKQNHKEKIKNFDIIIAEVSKNSVEHVEYLLENYSSKYFILFRDIEEISKYEYMQNSIVLQKNITYSDFINALSYIIDSARLQEIKN